MEFIAPNLANLVGSNIASKLMASAGGLENLANIELDKLANWFDSNQ